MIFIDIDGVLADSDGYLASLEPRVLEDTHILFKTIYKHRDKAFRYSKPLVDLSFIKELEDFTLLTALPNRNNIDSFCEDADKVLETLSENKIAWVKEHIGDCKLIIVNKRSDKVKYCLTSADILIDDSESTGKAWKEKGGKHFISVADFLKCDRGTDEEIKICQSWGDKESLW